jgi:hypothetical protein
MAINVRGRHTIHANTPRGCEPRLVSPWTLEAKEGTALHRLEKAYLDALCATTVSSARQADAGDPWSADRPFALASDTAHRPA